MIRLLSLLTLTFALGMTAMTDVDKPKEDKEDPYKLPDLKSKEWKKQEKTGIEIWDVKKGTGDEIPKGATVKFHYTGWLEDGTVFDSSKKRGEPISFSLNQLIQGWQEAIPGMKVGGVRRLKIPYKLAYGEQGRPPVIPAKADLIFEIEAIELMKK